MTKDTEENIVIFIVGGSGTGKSTVAEEMVKRGLFEKVTTCTTRNPREGEIDGVHYHFLNKEKLFDLYKNDELIEDPTEFSGNYYGCPKSSLMIGKPVVAIIEYEGVKKAFENLKNENIKPYYVFLEPLSEKEIKNRLSTRKGATEKELKERLAAREIEKEWGNFPYDLRIHQDENLGKNEQIDKAINQMKNLVFEDQSLNKKNDLKKDKKKKTRKKLGH